MNAIRRVAGLAMLAALSLILGSALNPWVPAALGQEGAGSKQPYTMPEYNAEQACANEKNPAAQVKCLDDFVAKYPNSALLQYVYQLYTQNYSTQKNWPKTIEYCDRLVALGDKIDPATRSQVQFQALNTRAAAYTAITNPDAAQAKAALDAAVLGLKTLDEIKKPDNVTQEAFDTSKKPYQIFLNGTAAQAAMVAKDYENVIKFYKAALTLNPDEPIYTYQMGRAYLAMTPPQTMEGYWAIARSITSKKATQDQVKKIKPYLRNLIAAYQGGTVCDSLTDAELNELLQLAASSAERPASYTLVGADQLNTARNGMTIASVISDLKTGGDKAKITWLAACGLEFPEVPGKVIEVTPGPDAIVFKAAFVTSEEEFNTATTPDMEIKVAGQPEAARVEKDSAFHFTATIEGYDPAPSFMVHWDKGKVKADDIPAEKAAPKKPAPRRPTRKPSGH